MKSVLTIVLLLTINFTFAQGIAFVEHDMKWQDILAKAKAEKKLVFVDAYTTWCGPCKMMSNNIFPKKEVGDVFNASFVNAKIDMEKGEGLEIAKKYNVRSYPTYLFVDGDGELVHRALGSKPAEKFIEDGQSAVDPNRQFYSLKKKFENGEKSPEFLKNISKAAQAAQDIPLATKASEAYLETQKDWSTKENMEFIIGFAQSIESKAYQYVIKNKAIFAKSFGSDYVESISIDVPMSEIGQKYYNRMTRVLDTEKAQNYLNQHLPKETVQQVMDYAALRIPDPKTDVPTALKRIAGYMDKYSSENSNLLNEFAWTFYEKTDDTALLQKAIQWSLKSIEAHDIYAFNDTAAALYFKSGDKSNAILYAEKAIKKAKEAGDNPSETENLLTKIKEMK